MPQNFAKVIMSTNPSQPNFVPSKIHKQRPKGLSNGRLGPLSVSKRSFKTKTALSKNVQSLIDASVKQRAERGKPRLAGLGEAGRPNNHVLWTQSSSTDFQETIQAVHKKPVARWWDPQAGRPHFVASQAQIWRGSSAQLRATDASSNTDLGAL